MTRPPLYFYLLILSIAAIPLFVAGCAKKSSDEVPLPVERVETSGQAPNFYVACWNGLTFLMTGGGHAMVQVFDSTGKPRECK